MNNMRIYSYLITLLMLICSRQITYAQNQKQIGIDSSIYYRSVKTYVNPVLPGDHPDPTLLKVGSDFYMCGSSFHFTPYLPVLHSSDLVHWKEISRVISPEWPELHSDRPGSGIWEGAITYFYGSFWMYFSNGNGGGQYFCKAPSAAGPWSSPIKVKTTSTTESIGYDNSVFIDEDGTPYMLTKSGKPINRIQKIGKDGHLTDDAINLDWINTGERYSWAEGPVMFKRKNWYYYTFAGDVSGGQYLYRTKKLTSDSTQWEALGNFFLPITDSTTDFRVSNHMSAAVQLENGSWWAIAQSYERLPGNDWSGQGRQSLLYQINWDSNDIPRGTAPTSFPVLKPQLSNAGYTWKLPVSDYFASPNRQLAWHFLSRAAAKKTSLTVRPGWVRLTPDTSSAHLLQKEAGHYYNIVTKLSAKPSTEKDEAGLYLTNGDESVTVKLYKGIHNGEKSIIFKSGDAIYTVALPQTDLLWLKIARQEHNLSAYYSMDGLKWQAIGKPVSVVELDKVQPDFNHWVGTSIGIFASGKASDFDLFLYQDGFSAIPAVSYINYFGVETIKMGSNKVVTNTSDYGGWLMLGGVDMGNGKDRVAKKVEVTASVPEDRNLELWTDDIEGNGKRIAVIPMKKTAPQLFQTFSASIPVISGQHDLYLRFPSAKNAMFIETIRFIP